MFFLSHLKISGHSMEPTFIEGQSVFASAVPYLFNKPKKGDILVFKNGNKLIIKRIVDIEGGKYKVLGDNIKHSRDFGFLKKSDILGKVIYK